jgi:hypothetical protein
VTKHGMRTTRTPEFVSFMKRHFDWSTRALTEFSGPVWLVSCVCGWDGPAVRDLKEAEKVCKEHEKSVLQGAKS